MEEPKTPPKKKMRIEAKIGIGAVIVIGFFLFINLINSGSSPDTQQQTANSATAPSSTPAVTTAAVQPQASAPTPTPQTSTATWHTVLTYTGPDTQNTEPFTMQGSQWKFVYSCTANSPATSADTWAGRLTGIIDSVSTGEEVNLFVNGPCPQNNTSYAYNQAPGQYALQVNSYNAAYSITIEDYY